MLFFLLTFADIDQHPGQCHWLSLIVVLYLGDDLIPGPRIVDKTNAHIETKLDWSRSVTRLPEP
ncbi:hypothetical protein Q671_15855 [Halomonas sp. PBN3]|nr:hypothetical protein Q671_15855 [Halomonas sp. PBN3]